MLIVTGPGLFLDFELGTAEWHSLLQVRITGPVQSGIPTQVIGQH